MHEHKGKSSERHLDKKAVLRALELLPGQSVLDAGCGNGYMSKAFAAQVGLDGHVVALDPDEEAITILQADPTAVHVEAVVADITRPTTFPKGSMDLIYLSTVFHGFRDHQVKGFVAEVKRLLKPGGKLAVVEIDKRETPFGPPLDIRFSPEGLQAKIPLRSLQTVRVGEAFYMQLFEKDETSSLQEAL